MKFGRLWTGVIVTQTAVTVIFLATVVSLGWAALRGGYSFDVTYAREQFMTAVLAPGRSSAGNGARSGIGTGTLQQITARLQAEPGVANATYATSLPGTTWERFAIEFATPEVTADAKYVTDVLRSEGARVGLNFFETVGIPLVSGRLFTDAEILSAHNVAVVDETFVRTILGGRNPLGLMVRQRSAAGGTPGPWHEIVGVVKDVTVMSEKHPHDAVLYRPAGSASPVRLLVRTHSAASPMTHTLQTAALSVDPDVWIDDTMSLDRFAEAEAYPTRLFLRMFAVVSAVALLLSTAGIYALISFTLARRTREIGIRLALGAAPRRIITGVFSRAFSQVGAGAALGALPGFVIIEIALEDAGRLNTVAGLVAAAAGLVATAAVCGFLLLVALVSCLVPLRRALRVEPADALRADG